MPRHPLGGALRVSEEPPRAAFYAGVERLWPTAFSVQIENVGLKRPTGFNAGDVRFRGWNSEGVTVARNPLNLERPTGFEPATSSLGSWHSATELRPPGASYSTTARARHSPSSRVVSLSVP